jgi:hypothetical protein
MEPSVIHEVRTNNEFPIQVPARPFGRYNLVMGTPSSSDRVGDDRPEVARAEEAVVVADARGIIALTVTVHTDTAGPVGFVLRPIDGGDEVNFSITARPDAGVAPPDQRKVPGEDDYQLVDGTLVELTDVRFGNPGRATDSLEPLVASAEALREFMPASVHHSVFNASSSNWSGARVDNPVSAFALAEATWRVPRVTPTRWALFGTLLPRAEAAMWVGLDSTDIFQAGSNSVCLVYDYEEPTGFAFETKRVHFEFESYYAWIELLPYAASTVPGLAVAPNDLITVQLFAATSTGTTVYKNGSWGGLAPQNDSIWVWMSNHTQKTRYIGTLPMKSGKAQFAGNTVEFILERPSTNQGPLPLANFCSAQMWDIHFADGQWGINKTFPIPQNDGTTQPFDGTIAFLNMADNGHLLASTITTQSSASRGDHGLMWFFHNPW